MTALQVHASLLLNLWLKSERIPLQDRVHDLLSISVAILITAILAIAVGTTTLAKGEAIAVELETFRFLAVAGSAPWDRGFFFSRHLKILLIGVKFRQFIT